jgi:DNA-directed RNA polymerase subunit RPC12/RpoP
MKLTVLKCPNCDGVIDNAEGLNTFFCKYCGHKIIIEELTEAEIKANLALKNMTYKENMQKLKNEAEAEKVKSKNNQTLNNNLFTLALLGMSLTALLLMMYLILKYCS